MGTQADDPLLELVAQPGGVKAAGPTSLHVGQKLTHPNDCREGVFAEWQWDGRRLELVNDRYGLYPLYYCDTGSAFRLSSSIPKLIEAGAPRDLDDAALSVFLRLGFFVGEDTPFLGIRALPPGARLVWQPGHLEVSHDLPGGPKLEMERRDAVDRYALLFREAMLRRAPQGGRVVIPLSGGQDSRHILFALLESGCHPACVTAHYYPPRNTPDAQIAAQVTRALGLEHRVLEQPPSQLRTLLRHHAVTNFCTLTPSSFLLVVGDVLRAETETTYDGLAGDVLSAGLFVDRERAGLFSGGRLEQLADNLLTGFNGGSGFHDDLLAKALGARWSARFSRRLAVDRLVRELERHARAANPITSFCFFNRTRRDIALLPFRAYAGVPTVHCPYLDGELFDFLLSLPTDLLWDHSFHRETIERAYPQWSHLPYAAWENATDSRARRHYRRFGREIVRYCRAGLRVSMLRPSYVVPRLARSLIDPGHGTWVAWLGPLIVYLRQLEWLAGKGFESVEETSDAAPRGMLPPPTP